MIRRLGREMIDLKDSLSNLSRLINDTAKYMVRGPMENRWRWGKLVIDQIVATGVGAVPIVSLISVAVGVILALQGAVLLARFGTMSYVATMVSVTVTRELGPLMAAIIVAGRSGSAFAAEIATMTVSEEIDALKTMGIPPVKMLVSPKTLALLVTMPCLAMIADFMAVAGGFMIGVTYLHVSFTEYMHQTLLFLTTQDIVGGLIKSAFFALIIALTGCYQGLQVRGGAEGVGRRTTQSVVTSIFMVILGDCFFTVLHYLIS